MRRPFTLVTLGLVALIVAVTLSLVAAHADTTPSVAQRKAAQHQAMLNIQATAMAVRAAPKGALPSVPAACPSEIQSHIIAAYPSWGPVSRSQFWIVNAAEIKGAHGTDAELFAGTAAGDTLKSVIVVSAFPDDPCKANRVGVGMTFIPYYPAQEHGALQFTSIAGDVARFSAADGTTGGFDIDTDQFVP